jgi:lycopene cyclase domain-containing protein
VTLTYLGVHAVFVLPVLALLLWRRPRLPADRQRPARVALLLMGTVAFAYTTPWDNLLIERGAWAYGEGRVLGALAWLGVAGVGGWLVVSGPERFFYLGAILAWACPVLALQWGVGGAFLLRRPRALVVGAGVPSLYLWIVDRIATADGVWTVAAETSTGVHLHGLPVEEAVFFLVVSALVVNGLVLFEWALLRVRPRPAGTGQPGTLGDSTDAGVDADSAVTDADPTAVTD